MKRIMAIVSALLLTGGIAFAAVTTGTFGDQNSNKVYRMQVDSDGIIYMPQDTQVGMGTTAPAAELDVGGYSRSYTSNTTTSLGVVGDIETDRNIYVGTGTITHLSKASTGQIFAGGSLEVDGMIYADGAIYSYDPVIYGNGQGVSFKATTTCGCKTFINGICTEKGTCS